MYEISKLNLKDFPPNLREINDPPKKLYVAGTLPDPKEYTYLTIVGSRKYSSYGKEVCANLILGLAGLPVVIVSGLALGIDTIAHKNAIANKIKTVAVPGSGLSPKVIYPRSNLNLAKNILNEGGALLSEYEPDMIAAKWSFPRRNRIMAGLSMATLIVEATEKSGTLITSRLAMEYNRDVLAIPGSIFNPSSIGPNNLIKDGATPINNPEDLIEALGLEKTKAERKELDTSLFTAEELAILNLLKEESVSRDILEEKIDLPVYLINIALSTLELKDIIIESDNKITLKQKFAKY